MVRRRRLNWGSSFALGTALVLLLALPAIAVPASARPVIHHFPVFHVTPNLGTVHGYVFGSRGAGTVPTPLAGVQVTVTEPNFVTTVAATVTNGSGGYSLSAPTGSYYVWSNQSGAWGGGGLPDRTNLTAGSSVLLNLTAYPYVGYGNATFVLPNWNRMASDMDRGNVMDSQQPLLSWSQDGAFYVNLTDQLVFYSFVNRTVTDIAPWVPLHTNVMDYTGWENEEFITPDGSWIYGLGCLASCVSTSNVTLYAVNVSTGRTFEYTWNVKDAALVDNGQVNLVGEQGNLSTAVLIETNGSMLLYNLWNRTEWTGGRLPFFEANNVYWIPYLSSYIDVQAEGSTEDGIAQYALSGPGDGTTFTSVFASHFGSGFLTNSVTGPVFNLSSRILVFDCFDKGAFYTFQYNLTPQNVLDSLTVLNDQTPGGSTYAHEKLALDITADEHRASLLASGPAFAGTFWPFFDNRSFIVDPFHSEFFETNQSAGTLLNQTYLPDQSSASSDSLDGLYFNASYLINPGSYNCDAGSCPINGGEGFTNGTIWWLWRIGLPEFPTPPTAPRAQDVAPGPVDLNYSGSGDTVELEWHTPTSGQYPMLNYTIEWGVVQGVFTNEASVPASTHSFEITGLPPEGTVYFGVSGWNLHWHGPWVQGNQTLSPGLPSAPDELRAPKIGAHSVRLRWDPPPETVSNYTLYWGTHCGKLSHSTNYSSALSETVRGLLSHHHYCFAVQAWNEYGGSPLSATLSLTTLKASTETTPGLLSTTLPGRSMARAGALTGGRDGDRSTTQVVDSPLSSDGTIAVAARWA